MKTLRREFISTVALLLALAATCLLSAEVKKRTPAAPAEGQPGESENTEQRTSAFVAKVYCVTVLEFNTDRPVQEARLLVDGKVLRSDTLSENTHKGLKVAAVVSRPEKRATIYLDTPQYRTHLQGPYQPSMDARVGRPKEYYGPGKDLRMSGADWTEIYRYTESLLGAAAAHYELKLEIR